MVQTERGNISISSSGQLSYVMQTALDADGQPCVTQRNGVLLQIGFSSHEDVPAWPGCGSFHLAQVVVER